MVKILGMIAAITLPFFNISLMMRIRRRKSSNDISLIWVFGVFACILAMFPAGILSKDLVFKLFSIVNIIFFSGVVYHVVRFRKKENNRIL